MVDPVATPFIIKVAAPELIRVAGRAVRGIGQIFTGQSVTRRVRRGPDDAAQVFSGVVGSFNPLASAQAQTIPNTGYQSPPTMGPPDPLLNPPVPGGGSSGSSGQGVPPGGGGGPRIPRGGTPPINPVPPIPVRVNWWPAWAISVLGPYAVPAGQAAYEWYRAGLPQPTGPKSRPKGRKGRGRPRKGPMRRTNDPGREYYDRGEGPPKQTNQNPLGLPPQINIYMPSPPPPRAPRAPPAERGRSALNLPNIARRYPITVASTGPIVARAPAQIPRTRGQQAAAIARLARPLVMPLLPSLLALGGGKSSSSRRRDPLTQPQVEDRKSVV
jgi:hypothetical protein